MRYNSFILRESPFDKENPSRTHASPQVILHVRPSLTSPPRLCDDRVAGSSVVANIRCRTHAKACHTSPSLRRASPARRSAGTASAKPAASSCRAARASRSPRATPTRCTPPPRTSQCLRLGHCIAMHSLTLLCTQSSDARRSRDAPAVERAAQDAPHVDGRAAVAAAAVRAAPQAQRGAAAAQRSDEGVHLQLQASSAPTLRRASPQTQQQRAETRALARAAVHQPQGPTAARRLHQQQPQPQERGGQQHPQGQGQVHQRQPLQGAV